MLTGKVALRRPDHVIVDCGGVGYRLAVSSQTLGQVPAVGSVVRLFTHLIVRDDAMLLYGFASEAERDLFVMLLGVQSVGPKVALDVLSGGPVSDLLGAIALGDSTRFQTVKGVGKRTAERIIVELREKAVVSLPEGVGSSAGVDGTPRATARDALVGLGYSPHEVERMLDGLSAGTPEELIAQALRGPRR
ncbi:MAG: Holliday junction branch migration protein RuvA [Solirubrobacteraceae bacterium]